MSVERIFVPGQGYANFDPDAPFQYDNNGVYAGVAGNHAAASPRLGRDITDVLRSLQRLTPDQVVNEFGAEVLAAILAEASGVAARSKFPSEDDDSGQPEIPTLSNRWVKSPIVDHQVNPEDSLSPQEETTFSHPSSPVPVNGVEGWGVKSPTTGRQVNINDSFSPQGETTSHDSSLMDRVKNLMGNGSFSSGSENTFFRTKIDWFSVSVENDLPAIKAVIDFLFRRHGRVTFEEFDFGHLGFTGHIKFGIAQSTLGVVMHGGKSQRGRALVQFPGAACSYIDTHEAQVLFSAFEKYRLQRVDLAADFYRGEVKVRDVVRAHKRGKFKTNGRPPKSRHIRCSCPTDGETVYIGTRSGHSYLRAYDKGKQQFPREHEEMIEHLLDIRSIANLHDGAPPGSSLYDWVRVEVEIKRTDKRPIPDDIIQNRDQYFAGMYPYLAEILPVAHPLCTRRYDKNSGENADEAGGITHAIEVEILIERIMAHLRKQYGKTLFSLEQHFGGSAWTVWRRIVKREHSQRLINAGLLIPEVVQQGRRRADSFIHERDMGPLYLSSQRSAETNLIL